MKLFSLKSKSLGYFNVPFAVEDDLTAINHIRNAVVNGNDSSLLVNLKDLELHSLCEFDVKKGISAARDKMVIDCAEIPLIAELAKEVMDNNVLHSDE